jgi:hypothetical protein
MGAIGQGATLLRLRRIPTKRRPPHQARLALHLRSPVQVLPSGEQDGLARGEKGVGYSQNGRAGRPKRDNKKG